MNNPIDPSRLPTLTEEVAIAAHVAPLEVPVLRQPLHGEAFADTLPMQSYPSLSASAGVEKNAAALIASIASNASASAVAPRAVLADPRPLPTGSVAMLPPWVHKVVTDAIDEALAQAMPILLEEITAHVRRRLVEAAQNPNRNLF
jgi:hypothetical protein